MALDLGLHRNGVVEEEAEGVLAHAQHEVDELCYQPHEGVVPGDDEAQGPPGTRCCGVDQGGHVRIAADDPVEGDEVGGFGVGGQLHEVTLEVSDAIWKTAGLRLGARCGDVSRRRFGVCAARRPARHQLQGHDTDSAAHVQEGTFPRAPVRDSVEEPARGLRRPPPPEATELTAGEALVEEAHDALTLGARHGATRLAVAMMTSQPDQRNGPPATGDRMRRIGVISDTHGLLRTQATEALQGSELILHAGDVGGAEILEELARIAPVHAVRGNMDWGDFGATLPVTAVVDLGSADGAPAEGGGGPLAYVLHDREQLDLDPATTGFRLVVFGHTHMPLVEERAGVLYLNPGSAGPERRGKPVSVARMQVEGETMEVELVELDV